MGWNTWCTWGSCGNIAADSLHDVCNETEVMSMATAMLNNGMYDVGFRYINMDDCWADDERAADGSIQPDPDRFPSGMAALASWLHAHGLKLGLYTSAGSTTCSQGGRPLPIPGSFGHYQQDASTFASWGVDYVKIDWCGSNLTNPQEQHTEFSQALNATGRHIYLELCRGYNFPSEPYCPEVAQAWRVGNDHADNFLSTLYEISMLVNQSSVGAPYRWNYADFLMTGGAGCNVATDAHCPGQTDVEYMTEFSLWSIAQSPLIVATDIRNLTSIMQTILLNGDIINIHQDTRTPPGDLLGYWHCDPEPAIPLPCQLWGRSLYNSTTYAAILLNVGNDQHNITLPFSTFGWADTQQATVHDLWLHEDLPGTYTGEYTATVESHAVNYIVLSKV